MSMANRVKNMEHRHNSYFTVYQHFKEKFIYQSRLIRLYKRLSTTKLQIKF